jgi:hypothetical protein
MGRSGFCRSIQKEKNKHMFRLHHTCCRRSQHMLSTVQTHVRKWLRVLRHGCLCGLGLKVGHDVPAILDLDTVLWAGVHRLHQRSTPPQRQVNGGASRHTRQKQLLQPQLYGKKCMHALTLRTPRLGSRCKTPTEQGQPPQGSGLARQGQRGRGKSQGTLQQGMG